MLYDDASFEGVALSDPDEIVSAAPDQTEPGPTE